MIYFIIRFQNIFLKLSILSQNDFKKEVKILRGLLFLINHARTNCNYNYSQKLIFHKLYLLDNLIHIQHKVYSSH